MAEPDIYISGIPVWFLSDPDTNSDYSIGKEALRDIFTQFNYNSLDGIYGSLTITGDFSVPNSHPGVLVIRDNFDGPGGLEVTSGKGVTSTTGRVEDFIPQLSSETDPQAFISAINSEWDFIGDSAATTILHEILHSHDAINARADQISLQINLMSASVPSEARSVIRTMVEEIIVRQATVEILQNTSSGYDFDLQGQQYHPNFSVGSYLRDFVNNGGTQSFFLSALEVLYAEIAQDQLDHTFTFSDGSWNSNEGFTRSQCFGAGTSIDMWPLDPEFAPDPSNPYKQYDQQAVRAKIWTKPIEEITASDVVVSFDDKTGHLVPGEVTRTMINNAKIILDFHGTFVTPGHVYWCAGGKFEGKYAPLIDILRDDGVIQHQDGTLIRASTGCEVGTPDDEAFYAFKVYTDDQGNERVRDRTRLRYGTRWMMPDGKHFTMREYMDGIGVEIVKDGPRKGYAHWKETGMTMPFAWVLSDTLPNPEDFILARSATSLEDIYKAGQWEFMRPQMPAPMVMDGGPIQPLPEHKLEMMPRNEPMAFTSAAPSSEMLPARKPTMNRKARKAAEARARLEAKNKRRKGETLH